MIDEKYFYEMLRNVTPDLVRALKNIIGMNTLSDEVGISAAMLSRYARRRSKPNKHYLDKIVDYLERQYEIIVRHASDFVMKEPHRREVYVLLGVIIALKYKNKIDSVIGFGDHTFSIPILVSQLLDRPLGVIWYQNNYLPASASCSFEHCGEARFSAICYSLPQDSLGQNALLVASSTIPNCVINAAINKLKRSYDNIIIFSIK